jgi:hypothetical protein
MVEQRRWARFLSVLTALTGGCGGIGGPDDPAATDRIVVDGSAPSDGSTDAAHLTLDGASVDASLTDVPATPSGNAGENPFDLPMAVSSGGAVLAAPRVQAIYLAGFPYPAEMDQLLGNLGASAYWGQVTGEYGVGPLTILPSDHSDSDVPSTITNAGIAPLFQAALTAHAATLGPPRADTIYVLFLPPTTTLTVGNSTFCGRAAPSAYHREVTASGVTVSLVVIPTCSSYSGDPTLTGAEVLAPPLAHELVEAATDPLPDTSPAFASTDPQHALWTVAVSGGEVADLCENEAPNLITPADVGFPVPRVWSNVAARGLGGPCVPVPADAPYFTAVAHLPDTVRVQLPGGTITTIPTLVAPAGAATSVTVELRPGLGAPSSWQVLALEYHGQASVMNLGPSIRTAVVAQAGETRSIPVVAPADATTGVFPLIIFSHSAQGALHLWVGAIQRR